ncbi:MAG: response regulator transcription factor [Bacteroidota bacterium]
MVRILLVDDHKIILDSLSLLINMMEGIEVVGTLDDSRKVIQFIEENELDLLMTDLSMPYLNGIELSHKVKSAFPKLPILMLTVNDDPGLISDAFKMGISGYVIKKAKRDELEKAIKTVASGELYYSQAVMRTLLTGNDVDTEKEKLKLLTNREIEVIRLIVQEKSTNDIAKDLFISSGTVEAHRRNIFKKLGVKNVVGVVKFAMKYNLVDA